MDERWIHHYTPVSKECQPMAMKGRKAARASVDTKGQSTGLCVLDTYVILLSDFPPKGQTMTVTTRTTIHDENDGEIVRSKIWFTPTSSNFYFADVKLQGKRFDSDGEVIAEIETFFQAKDTVFDKKGIESLERRCIAMKTLTNKVRFCQIYLCYVKRFY